MAKYMGDGVLVYFGYPQAHEDDAERAVRAGLELIEAVGALKLSAPVQTRVGIATGLVVVGDQLWQLCDVGRAPYASSRVSSLVDPHAGRNSMTTLHHEMRSLIGDEKVPHLFKRRAVPSRA